MPDKGDTAENVSMFITKQLFFEKFRGEFPVFTGFIFENLIYLAVVAWRALPLHG